MTTNQEPRHPAASASNRLAAMTEEELNRALAEGIGLPICACAGAIVGVFDYTYNAAIHGACGGLLNMPPFHEDFNLLLATEEHGGFTGPVAWLDAWREGPGAVAVGRLSGSVGHVLGAPMWYTRRKGPRALAEACLRAIWAVKAAGDGEA